MSSRKIDVSIILSQNHAPSIRFWVLGAVIILTLVRFAIGNVGQFTHLPPQQTANHYFYVDDCCRFLMKPADDD